jgi:hypothetical protein
MSFEARLMFEFARKRSINSRYSVRAFARTLGADAGSLSQVLRGLRRATPRQVTAWCDRLDFAASEREVYTALARHPGFNQVQAEAQLHQWAEDTIALTQNPAHLALLAAARSSHGQVPLAAVARGCGCTMDALQLAMSRLLRLGWLSMPVQGPWRDLTGIPVLTAKAYAAFVARQSGALRTQFGLEQGTA